MNGLAVTPSLAAAGRGAAPAGSGGNDLRTLARQGDLATITVYVRQHPGDRKTIEHEMIAAGRTGDVSHLAQALKKPDFDVAVWLHSPYGDGPGYRVRPPSDQTNSIASSGAWPGLIQSGKVSASEQRIMSQMSDNEGRFDSVQSYDSQIATAGAMQKAINPHGTGELPKQVWDFKQANPAKYQALFADRGWTVEHTGKGNTASDYTMRLTVGGNTLSARETADYIKDHAQPDHWTTALDPLMRAGRDPDFQAIQLRDFKTRLDTAMATVPRGASPYAHPASNYVTSEQGAALVLDQHVNGPALVRGSLGRALDTFYAAHPKASRDPAQWTAKERTAYEPEIMAAYQTQRRSSGMADPVQRYEHIAGAGTTLSNAPGSYLPAHP